MQWRRQKRITHVIGSSNHVLLLARYQDGTQTIQQRVERASTFRSVFFFFFSCVYWTVSRGTENVQIPREGGGEGSLH